MAKTETSQTQIVEKNIEMSKEDMRKAFLKDELIIFFTRMHEDLQLNKKDVYGRFKELFSVIFPYDDVSRNFISAKIKDNDFGSKDGDGLELDVEEKKMLSDFCKNVNNKIEVKTFENIKFLAKKNLAELNKKYLPNASLYVEPFILGKIISFFGGIENLYKKPASTIQILGAEKAFFRFKKNEAKGAKPPKYGFIYTSGNVQKSKDKGKKARQMSNKLSIAIKLDYFQKFRR